MDMFLYGSRSLWMLMRLRLLAVQWWLVGMALCLLSSTSQAQETTDSTKPEIGFVGLHGGIYEKLVPMAKALDVGVTYFDDALIESGMADFGSVKVLYLQHHAG
jgi:cobaltochelatase CobN